MAIKQQLLGGVAYGLQFGGATEIVEAPPTADRSAPLGLRVVRMAEICERLCCGETFVRSEIAKGRFPPGFKLGSRETAWLEEDLDRFIADRAARRLTFTVPPTRRGDR
jgi:prophage regulatory protein